MEDKFHAPSFRYVEDESSEWSDLDYKLKVPDNYTGRYINHTFVTLFSNILVNIEPDLTFLGWEPPSMLYRVLNAVELWCLLLPYFL